MLESRGPKRRIYNIKKGYTILETATKLLELYLWQADKGLAQLPMTGLPEKAEKARAGRHPSNLRRKPSPVMTYCWLEFSGTDISTREQNENWLSEPL